MRGQYEGVLCLAVGLSLAWGGWRLIRSREHPPGTTGFEGVAPNARGARMMLGNLLLVLGLILAVIFSAFFFIGG